MTATAELERADQTARAKPRSGLDAVSVLSGYVFLLLAIPSDQGIGALGAAGSPAGIYALGMLIWWIWHHVRHPADHSTYRWRPVRRAMFAFVVCVLVSYGIAALSALPGEDAKATDMALVSVASYAGVLLVANDGIADRERFAVLTRRIALMGGVYAGLGLVQFFTGQNFVDALQIPGLTSSGSGGIDVRGGFLRPEATARHPLEYAAVLSMILPLAVTAALTRSGRSLVRRSWPAAAITLAAVVSITRSALLGVVVGIGVLIPTWDRKMRRMALAVGSAALVGMYLLVPGLAGTLLGMFGGDDPSLKSRTDSYDAFWSYFVVHPVLGRGLGSLSSSYHIFDNQFLGLLIEVGVVGTAAFSLLVVTAVVTAYRSRRDPEVGALGPATAGMVLAGTLLCGFFDAFHFPQAVGILFLGIGLCGALRRMADPTLGPALRQDAGSPRTLGRILLRRWYVFAPVLLLAAPAGLWARSAPGVYYTKVTVEFQAPPGATKDNPLRTEAWSLVGYAAMIERLYEQNHAPAPLVPNSAPIFGAGLKDAEAVYLRNDGGQWQTSFDVPLIDVEIVGRSAPAVAAQADETTAELVRLSSGPQDALGVWKQAQITAVQRPTTADVVYVPTRSTNAVLVWAAAALAVAAGAAAFVDNLLMLRRQRRRL